MLEIPILRHLLNDLKIVIADVGNAYLEVFTREKLGLLLLVLSLALLLKDID